MLLWRRSARKRQRSWRLRWRKRAKRARRRWRTLARKGRTRAGCCCGEDPRGSDSEAGGCGGGSARSVREGDGEHSRGRGARELDAAVAKTREEATAKLEAAVA